MTSTAEIKVDRDKLRRIIIEEARDFLIAEGRVIEHPADCARAIADRVVERVAKARGGQS